MKKTLIAILATCSLSVLAVDLEEAYDDALANDPILAAASASHKLSKQDFWTALSALMPGINASMSRGRSDFERGTGGGDLPFIIQEGISENQSWSVGLNQVIFDAQTILNFFAVTKSISSAEWDYIAAEQQLITRVAEAYLNVLQAQDNLDSSLAAEEAVQRQLEQVQQRFDVGLVAITDVLDATASYDLAVVDRLTSRSTHGIFFESLRTVTGIDYSEVAKLKDDLPIQPPDPNDEEAWVQAAMTTSPAVRGAEALWQAAKQNRAATYAFPIPSVRLSASKRYSEDPLSVFTNESTTTSWSLSASMPILNGGRNFIALRQTALQAERSKQLFIQAQLRVSRDTRNYFRLVQNDVERVSARLKSIQSSQASLEATQTGYEVGTRNIVEVLQKQQQLYQAIFAYASSRYTYILNGLRLKETVGSLSRVDLELLNEYMDPSALVTKITTASGKPAGSN